MRSPRLFCPLAPPTLPSPSRGEGKRTRCRCIRQLGSSGLYIVAVVSGLTDVDAITLSTASLVNHDQLGAAIAWRIIVVAALSNLVFKAGAVAVLGRRELLTRVAVGYGVVLAAGLALVAMWPR